MTVRQTCLVLAGGLGTRLRDAIDDLPKILAPVGARSFLEIQVSRLASAGITDIVLSLGYKAGVVVEALARCSFPVPVRYVCESKPLGTGGAIANALAELQLDEILVANGDTYLDGDLSPMLVPLDTDSGEVFRLACVEVADRSRFGGIDIDAAGRVRNFLEKGQAGKGVINAGLYRLCRAALPSGYRGAFSLERDVLPGLAKQRAVTARLLDSTFIDIGVPDDYRIFCARYAA